MSSSVANSWDLPEVLRRLVELEYDAMSAYRAAILRIEDPQAKQAFEGFQADHLRHAGELSDLLRRQGLEPPDGGNIRQVLTVGRVVIGNLAGKGGILAAMRSDETDTNCAYEDALRRTDLSPAARAVIERALDDERRHRSWIETQQLAR